MQSPFSPRFNIDSNIRVCYAAFAETKAILWAGIKTV